MLIGSQRRWPGASGTPTKTKAAHQLRIAAARERLQPLSTPTQRHPSHSARANTSSTSTSRTERLLYSCNSATTVGLATSLPVASGAQSDPERPNPNSRPDGHRRGIRPRAWPVGPLRRPDHRISGHAAGGPAMRHRACTRPDLHSFRSLDTTDCPPTNPSSLLVA